VSLMTKKFAGEFGLAVELELQLISEAAITGTDARPPSLFSVLREGSLGEVIASLADAKRLLTQF
jgi:hypothetical protein